jgi:hypothetical protein
MRNIKPPTIDGENMKVVDDDAWLLEMRNYFQLHNHSSQVEYGIEIYQLREKHQCGGTSSCR